ncbi:hypothetical protein LUZ60_001195 [Juncus effusus]|nr:hypothetical protein LUZ60_001195 [Juncus effusus]
MYTQGSKSNPAAVFSAAALAVFLLPLRGGAAGLLWRTLLNLLSTLLSLFFLLLSVLPSPVLPAPSFSSTSKPFPTSERTTCASRALSHVLSMVSFVPVSSRKYELVRSLAERLLDETTQFNAELNQLVLSESFSRTLHRLERTIMDGEWGMVGGTVKKAVRKWWPAVVVDGEEREEGFGGAQAEKLAAELLWLGQKMAECGAVKEAVVSWGQAARLGSFAVSAEPRLQVAFVRVTVFLLRHANSIQFEEDKGLQQEQEISTSQNIQMEILKSWLPLLCRATNGSDSPVLNSREKMEMVRLIEDLIEKLSWQQQEVVLAIWLHHFSASPNSDWPNLESCYTRWYSNSCKLLLK